MIYQAVSRFVRGGRRHQPALAQTGVLVAMALLLGLPVSAARAAEEDSKARHIWLDAGGRPLPFQSHGEIEEFLRNGKVLSRKEIGVGINRMDRLLLESGGVQAHAIFRDVDVEKERTRVGERYYQRFKDFYAGECAAYALAELLGMDNVPPVVLRDLDGRDGSMQIWIEQVRDSDSDSFQPPNAMEWVRQGWDMAFFDNLILNVDRNAGNMLIGQHYRLWLIDHTRAFEPQPELLAPDRVHLVNRRLWTRMNEITEKEVAAATREFLDPQQLSALQKRWKLLEDHVQGLIGKLGRGAVLH